MYIRQYFLFILNYSHTYISVVSIITSFNCFLILWINTQSIPKRYFLFIFAVVALLEQMAQVHNSSVSQVHLRYIKYISIIFTFAFARLFLKFVTFSPPTSKPHAKQWSSSTVLQSLSSLVLLFSLLFSYITLSFTLLSNIYNILSSFNTLPKTFVFFSFSFFFF